MLKYYNRLKLKKINKIEKQFLNSGTKLLRIKNISDIEKLPEYQQRKLFLEKLQNSKIELPFKYNDNNKSKIYSTISNNDMNHLLDATLSTFLLHVECRIASSIQEGFYTIGPCGEELLGTIGLILK